MKVQTGTIGDVFAWLLIENGQIVQQGYDENMQKADQDMKAAVWFWSVHEYERD